MTRRTLAILAAVAAIALVAVSAAFAASPLENPGFETGDLSSWETNPTEPAHGARPRPAQQAAPSPA